MSNKTVNVFMLLEWANKNLGRVDEFATVEYKAGICSMIEMVLHESGNYAGFHFNDSTVGNDTGTLDYYTRSYYSVEVGYQAYSGALGRI